MFWVLAREFFKNIFQHGDPFKRKTIGIEVS
jgi:hypothetical protein